MTTLVTRAAYARGTGISDVAVSKKCRPGGALAAACEGKRIDLDHHAAIADLRRKGVSPSAVIAAGSPANHRSGHSQTTRCARGADAVGGPALRALIHEPSPTIAEFAAKHGVPALEVLDECASALIPVGHIVVDEFAQRAECTIEDVLKACEPGGALNAALVKPNGRLDLGHPASLEFLAARPFARDKAGDPICPDIDGCRFLLPACVGENIDMDHAVARAFIARCHGRHAVSTHAALEKAEK